jgi:molybdopterin converting factor small subunit
MNVRVHYLAQLRAATSGVATETVELPPPAAVADLVNRLIERHGEAFRRIVVREDGQPRQPILYFVNDDQAVWSHSLHADDVVTLLAPMAGG